MMKVLIAYDGSATADSAILDLAKAGLPSEVEARVISVADVMVSSEDVFSNPYLPPEHAYALQSAYERGKVALASAKRHAKKAEDYLKAHFPSWKIDTCVPSRSPSEAILDESASWGADLIVMGAHKRTAVGKIFFGSVSQSVLHHASCNVRISRARLDEKITPVRIVVGVDGSFPSEMVVQTIQSRVWPKGSAAHLVTGADERILTAVAFGPEAKPWVKKDDEDPLAWVSRMMKGYEKRLESSGFIVSSLIREGNPRDVLLHEAHEWGADTIFIGSRGLGMGERLILGSVSNAVASRAHCSVEVIHAAKKEME